MIPPYQCPGLGAGVTTGGERGEGDGPVLGRPMALPEIKAAIKIKMIRIRQGQYKRQ